MLCRLMVVIKPVMGLGPKITIIPSAAKRQAWHIFAAMVKLARWVQKAFLLVPAWIRLGNLKWAYRLTLENFPLSEMNELRVQQGVLCHGLTGIKVDDHIYPFVKGGLIYWKGFASYGGVSAFRLEGNKLMATVDHVRFQVHHAGTLFVIEEIFAERLYDLRVKEELIVLDIGMNVGVASLYFAGFPNVRAVVGFEPLEETYSQALENIALNPEHAGRIKTCNFGISDYEGTVEVPAVVAGSAVFSTNQDFIETLGQTSDRTVPIRIRPVDQVVRELLAEYPGFRICLKLDCEGEEYRIMDKLAADGLMKHIAVVAMEWHFKGFETLCKVLEAHDFAIFNLGRKEISPPCGMIYGFNLKKLEHA